LYLTNAYHFYSPDPGSPSLLWFSVQYEDGSRRWIRIPERQTSPIGMHYQRMLALPEHTFAQITRLPYSNAELAMFQARDPKFVLPERGSWEDISTAREVGSTRLYPLEVEEDGQTVIKALPIPTIYDVSAYGQYREPTELSKKLIASVAKRIMKTAPPADSGAKPRSVKLYRVIHQTLTPKELADGVNPLAKTKHWAYFLGEFNAAGELVTFDPDGKQVQEYDPFLYWYIPIINVSKKFPEHLPRGIRGAPMANHAEPATKDSFVLDGLEMHAAGEIKKRDKKQEKNR
jgi:hypothetical protein